MLAEKKKQMIQAFMLAYPFILYIFILIAPYANSLPELIYGMEKIGFRPKY